MCTTSWFSPRTDSTSMYSGSSVVKNVTSASHQPCSRTLPWSISHACNETAAASESTRQVRDCRRYRVNRPTAASTDPAHHGSQAGTASRGALRFAASLDRILTPATVRAYVHTATVAWVNGGYPGRTPRTGDFLTSPRPKGGHRKEV